MTNSSVETGGSLRDWELGWPTTFIDSATAWELTSNQRRMKTEIFQECRPGNIIIPFYKNVALVRPLFESLEGICDELSAAYTVIAVNDSPDDADLEVELGRATEQLSRLTSCTLIRNSQNIGFVRSVNRVLATTLGARRDAILLNSDTIVFPGALTELRRVAYLDPMTGFASPRSNNSTICSLPCQKEFRHSSPIEAYRNFRAIASYLPDYHYVPTAVGFCLFIKWEILAEFGAMDEVYGMGYNEENDLIMRANRCGYRAVLANHAFVYHAGESSFSMIGSAAKEFEKKNADLLHQRYPEYPIAVRDYFNSPRYRAEEMLSALLPDSEGRLDLVFDFSSTGPYHNGTFEAGKRLLRGALQHWRRQFNLYAMVSDEARKFHKLDELPNLFFVSPEVERSFAVSFRFGQPFDHEQLARMSRTGIVNVFVMQDTIALDCLYLRRADLDAIWGFVCQYANGVIYISDFVRDQFRRRFRFSPRVRELVAYHSLDPRDYAKAQDTARAGDYILVIGNPFEHKRVPVTVDALNGAFPRVKTVALGINSANGRNVVAYPSGNLSEGRMRNLLCNAKFVVYPSLYEGFGLPVLEALAYYKPVMARSIPVMREIRKKIAARENLILYDSTSDLIARLEKGFPEWQPVAEERNGAEPHNWSAVARQIREFLESLLAEWSFSDSLLPRLEFVSQMQGAPNQAELLDRETVIKDIYNSYSWRLTAPMRRVGAMFLPLFNGGKK